MTTQAKSSAAALALVAALGLGGAGVAQAHGSDDVFWSIGVSQPGIQIGVSNGPVMVPAPYPVVVQPRVVYYPRPVYYPQPVYRVAYPGYYERGHAYGHWRDRDERWEGRRGGREEFDRDDRDDRYEGRGDHGGRRGGNGPRPGFEGYMGNRR